MFKKIAIGLSSLALCAIAVFIYCVTVFADPPITLSDECSIGGKVFSNSDKLEILEIVPHEAYDELGLMIGNDQGTITWNDIVDKYKSETDFNTVKPVLEKYTNFFQGFIGSSSEKMILVDKNDKQYANPWDITSSDWSANNQNISNFTPYLWSDVNTKKIISLSDGSTYRNFFAKSVFGSYDMEDKINLVVKEAKNVTKADVDNCDLIYINTKVHSSFATDLYNVVRNESVAQNLNWVTNNNDLSAEVALYIYRQNAFGNKAVIFQAKDKHDIEGKYCNISRISLLFCAIDRDVFIRDYASEGPDYGSTYTGLKGKTEIKDGVIKVYDENGDEIAFKATMFNNEAPLYGKSSYPYYNSTDARYEYNFINNGLFSYNTDNSLTSQFNNRSIYQDDYDPTTGVYYGTTYADAIKKMEATEGKISPAEAIRYILGDYEKNHDILIDELRVLEVQPSGYYEYDDSVEEDRKLIMSWFGVTDYSKTDVTIEHLPMNGFIGLNSDITSDYDLIIIGGLKEDANRPYTYTATGKQAGDYSYFGINDLTDKMLSQLKVYMSAGLPIVLNDGVYYSKSTVVEQPSIIAKLNMADIKTELINNSKSYGNIICQNNNIAAGKKLEYKQKPEISLSEKPIEYDGSDINNAASTLLPHDQLSNIRYKGKISNAGKEYSVKLYFDRNCDSMFSDDTTSAKAELFYEGVYKEDGTGDGELNADGSFDISIELPDASTGYIGWMLKTENLENNLVKYQKGAFVIDSTSNIRMVTVLQVIPSGEGNIDLTGTQFTDCFSAAGKVSGLEMTVDKMTKDELNDAIAGNPGLLKKYSIVVFGMEDNYGNDDTFTDETNDAIEEYIKNGNSCLYTHDSMSCRMESNNSKYVINESELKPHTKRFKTYIGMKDGVVFTDSIIQKITRNTLYGSKYKNGKTITTKQVMKLNEGQITNFPYALDDKTMPVQQTHGQYYKLDMEQQADKNDVVVWYTLSNDNSDTVNGTFFDDSGQDAMNNYYIYSKGNITYTSSGHEKVNGDKEMQLFVNTFIRSIMSGNSVPKVKFEDAVYDNNDEYSQLVRTPDKLADISVNIKYSVTDSDLVTNKGYLKSSYMFYDANENDMHDASDPIIGYMDSTGTVSLGSSESYNSGKAVLSGHEYVNNINDIISDYSAVDSTISNDMKQKLLSNRLKIGIVGIDDQDAEGSAVLKIIFRKLYDLE